MKFFTTLFLAGSLVFIASCKKKDCSDNPESVTLTASTPVYEGWPLYLSTESGMGYSYSWTGPNGWHKDYGSSNMNGGEIIDSMTAEKAGRYVVDLKSDGCIVKRGIVDVVLAVPPSPPCNVNNNSSTTTLGGVGGTTYTYVSSGSSGSDDYHIQASSGSSQSITFRFKSGHIPLPGVYKSNGSSYPEAQNEVGIYIGTGFQDFVMKPDFDIYVNKVNGNTVISFCSAGFYNSIGSTNIVVSAKVTIP
jgi:hypothetical protein